ncbi:MAG: AMIN domain-containing protein [Gemmatimonadetes bacterium]|nr:AMIN domain-containing protein [Gemmatimonadota bacterium]NIR80900.1 AMIN domain-containing protein [Gemmatimonadota bacterium]NIT88562.1 AMIN domain-containing protein [Gemmatimonadota bacterium]NIU33503.1 AMIN domain-containing protein [Gemmatimonadota bacterium]NIV63834.1 AMIN domain-containing protein [Gemmatimonadota bacterium]
MTSLLALWAGLVLAADAPVEGVSILPAAEQTEIVITVQGEPRYRAFTMEGPHRLVVDFMGARHALPRDNYPGINRGGVLGIRSSQYSDEIVRIVLELVDAPDYAVVQGDGMLRIVLENRRGPFEPWSSRGLGESAAGPSSGGSATPDNGGSAAGSSSAFASAGRLSEPVVNSSFPLQQRGRRITISFTSTPIQDVLFTFSEYSGRSIVPGAQVSGQVTADIRDQPWDVALQAILDAQGLVARETPEGIIRVDNLQNLSARDSVVPLVTRPFRINFATAEELQQSIQPLLSSRGRISVGTGTNTLVVTDRPSVVEEIEALVEQLDVRTPQVQIQAKIIFVNRTDLNEFGVTYDLKDSQGNQLNTITPGAVDQDGDGLIELPEEQVDVGEDVISLGGSSIAALGNANQRVASPSLVALTSLVVGSHTLISFVQALESLNLSDIQAAPSLTVMDNVAARIQVGERTPVRVIEAGGQAAEGVIPQATVDFQETGVILEVTPHVTADETILLELHAERSAAELAEAEAGFIFRTQEADSRVLVQDGETVVIGGLTTTEQNETQTGIPLLMDLPLLGRLFRVTRHQTIQQDLIILVTPHIVRETTN